MPTKADKKHEDWMQSKWRPAMGWLYMATCAFDFVIFPVLHAIYIVLIYKGATPPGIPMQWSPLTLQGAGLYHLAMGAVLGVAAWSRGQEKIAGATGGLPTPGGLPTQPGTNSWGSTNTAPSTGSFGSSPSTGWTSTTPNTAPSMAPTGQTLPPPPTRPGVRLAENPSARTVLPDADDDADKKIK